MNAIANSYLGSEGRPTKPDPASLVHGIIGGNETVAAQDFPFFPFVMLISLIIHDRLAGALRE